MASVTTKLIADRSTMRHELRAIRPTHIAVAYVGKDWRWLLGTDHQLRQIVVAPVPGTSPKAIRQIAREIGWDNVHFFDQLHAKVYLGPTHAMIGSANLSSNALLPGGTQLYEMVVLTDDMALREHAMLEWERYHTLASGLYRSRQDKLDRLVTLEEAQPKIEAARLSVRTAKTQTLATFKVGSVPIHLEWWESELEGGCDPDDTNYINTRVGQQVDEIRIGNWVLQWACDAKGRPYGRSPLQWMRIDAIRFGQAPGEDVYVDQLAERVKPTTSMQPFVLDADVQKAFKSLMLKSGLRPEDLNNESYEAIPLGEVDEFLFELRKLYRSLRQAK